MNLMTQSRWIAMTASLVLAGSLDAAEQEVRYVQPAPPPQQPGIQQPEVDPTSHALSASKLGPDALQDSAGRQLVVLPFPPTDSDSWPQEQNTFPANQCKEALGDRYGRVLSRQPIGDRWYFSHVVCETPP